MTFITITAFYVFDVTISDELEEYTAFFCLYLIFNFVIIMTGFGAPATSTAAFGGFGATAPVAASTTPGLILIEMMVISLL
jgi:hypothetical protein